MVTRPSSPWWSPEALAARRPFLEARGRIVAALRAWFAEQGFTEVETPALQAAPGAEVHLRYFATELAEPFGQGGRRMYLHSSPEFAMKKLLAGGLTRIHQFARVYRNGERSSTHHPEFTLLEWYRTGVGYGALMDDVEALTRRAQEAGGRPLRWQGRTLDARQPWERLAVAEAFGRHAGIDLLATAPDPHRPDAGALAEAARGIGVRTEPRDTWEDLFFRIMLDRIEPHLGAAAPCILYDYPLSMAALARPKPEDPRLAERFEVYVGGLELANAFGELTDPAEQRRRLAADSAERQRLYGEPLPLDADFLAALDHGLPAAAGIALGLDRLVMLASGATRIEDVLWAPVAEA